MKLGVTTVLSWAENPNLTAATQREFELPVYLFNTTATAQRALAKFETTFTPSAVVTGYLSAKYGTATEDTTSARTLDVTVQWATANANNSFQKKMAVLEFLP